MKLYSDIPARRTVQVAADVGIVLWVVLWVRVAARVHDATMALAEPGRNLAGAGGSFRDTMAGAGDNVDDLPLLEDRIATPFRSAAGVGTEIERAGNDLVTAVERLSLVLALTTALVPILIVGCVWLVPARPVRPPRRGRAALHRRRSRPRPLRAARHGQPAHAAAGRRLRRPGRRLAARRPRGHPRPRPARAPGERPAAATACYGVTTAGRRSASGQRQVVASASTCSPERMSLTWSPSSSPAPGNQTNGMPRRSA